MSILPASGAISDNGAFYFSLWQPSFLAVHGIKNYTKKGKEGSNDFDTIHAIKMFPIPIPAVADCDNSANCSTFACHAVGIAVEIFHTRIKIIRHSPAQSQRCMAIKWGNQIQNWPWGNIQGTYLYFLLSGVRLRN